MTRNTHTLNLERQVFHLQTLYEVAHALNQCRSATEIYRQVLTIMTGTLGVEYALALDLSSDGYWKVAAGRGLNEASFQTLEETLDGANFNGKQSSSKKRLLQEKLLQDMGRDFADEHAVWVELKGRSVLLGGILFGQKLSGKPYSDADHELIEAVASHVARALENQRLYDELKDAEERLQIENITLREEVLKEYEDGRIIGQSDAIQKVLQQVKNIARSPTNVLIYGETGTGKELVAKSIHYSSPRRDRPFIAVNCTAIPENLVESELFGIEAGVATGVKKHIGFFEQADSGTLFIDEIGDMPVSSQAKILRALQERSFRRVGGTREISVDVRVVAATNKDLQREMKEGNFREDLFFRLSVLEITVPTLRARPDDLPLLINHFQQIVEKKLKKQIKGFSTAAVKAMQAYAWPGNVREVENEVERAITMAPEDALLQPEDLSQKFNQKSTPDLPSPSNSSSLRDAVDTLETRLISQALEKHHWNKSAVARQLGLSRLGLQKKLDRLGITPDPKD